MRIENGNNMSSEMALSISNHMKDMVSGNISNEDGLELIKTAISKGMPQPSTSAPIDILSISKEAFLQADAAQNNAQSGTFSMTTAASMEAENNASKPQGIMAAVAEEAIWAALPPALKLLKTVMPILEEFSEELVELNEEQRKIAIEELAQTLQEEKEAMLEEAYEGATDTPSDEQNSSNEEVHESAKDTPSDAEGSGNSDAKPINPNDNGDSGTSEEPVLTTGGDTSSSEPTITTGGGDSGGEIKLTTSDSGGEIKLTTSDSGGEIKLTTSDSGGSGGEVKLTTSGSGDSGSSPKELKINTRKSPPTPSIDIVV